jgi:two-component system response regulator HydG
MTLRPAPKPHILIADDDLALVETLCDGLMDAGYDVLGTGSSREAAALLDTQEFDALVTDLRMPGVDGLGLLAISQRLSRERPVIVMTAYSAVDTAVESIRMGAYHYLTKPFKVGELALFLERALAQARLQREARALRQTLGEGSALARLVGRQGGLREVSTLVSRVAEADVPVLVLGETGTGKGLVVRALHFEGGRGEASLVTVNCAALPEQLLESELFGHMRGAFTGANANRRGLLEEANGGTLFLDEIGELALPLQAKLLHVLEKGVVRAVGSNREVPVNVRFVAATHRDLKAEVATGRFREDLLFRLDVITIDVPPLRQRTEDLPELADTFLEAALTKHPRSAVRRFSAAAMDKLTAYTWPGNVRELEHLVQRSVLLVQTADIEVGDLPPSIVAAAPPALTFRGPIVTLDEMQRRYASWALDQLGGRRMLTAETLDVDRKTLVKLLGDGARLPAKPPLAD